MTRIPVPKTVADTQQCPFCRDWIQMPLRRRRQAFEAHQRKCNKKAFRARDKNHDRIITITIKVEEC